jgi:hypothetical protein
VKLVQLSLTAVTWFAIALFIFLYLPDSTQLSWINRQSGWLVPFPITLAVCFVTAQLLKGFRWKRLTARISTSDDSSILQYLWFFTLTTFSFLRLGELSKLAWALKRASKQTAVSLLAIEKFHDIAVLTTMLLVSCVALLLPRIWEPYLLVVLVGFAATYQWLPGLLRRIRLSGNEIKITQLLYVEAFGETRRPASLLSLLSWGMLLGGYYVSLTPVVPAPLASALIMVCMVNFSGFLNLTPGNIGIYELAVSGVLIASGMSTSNAIWFAIELHFIILVMTFTLGVGARGLIFLNSR